MALKSLRHLHTKASPPGSRVMATLLPGRGMGWPGLWGSDRFSQVQHFRNWNYVSANTICSKIGQLVPNLAYVHHQPKPERIHRKWLSDYGGTRDVVLGSTYAITNGFYQQKTAGGSSILKPHEDLEPLEYDHPLRRLIENPNEMDTTYDLFYELQMFIELCGVSYLWMVPNGWGVPCELWVIPAHWVYPRTRQGVGYWSPGQDQKLIDYYEIRPWNSTGGGARMLRFPADEVLMFFNKNPQNKLDGWSVQAAGDMWIDTEESIVRSRWAQMCNQARSDVHIQASADITDPDDDRISRLEAKFMAKYQGELNFGKPIITSAGTKVTPLSFSPQEMAYFQCCSADTECLTAEGWKKYTELTRDSLIACFDQPSGMLEYHKPSNINVQDYAGPMHHWVSREADVLVTPEHRMMVRVFDAAGYPTEEYGKDWLVKRMHEMPQEKNFRIKVSGPIIADEVKTVAMPKYRKWAKVGPGYDEPEGVYELDADLWAQFLGWYVSEGHIAKDRPRFAISQKIDSPSTPVIEKLLKDLFPFEFAKNVCGGKDNRGCYQWYATDKGVCQHLIEHCGKTARFKKLPRYVMGWSHELLRSLLFSAVSGDGTDMGADKYGHQHWVYRTTSPQLAEDIAEITIKCGLRATVMKSGTLAEDGQPESFMVKICDKTYANIHRRHQKTVPYRGKVWCVTVPTGLFVVRRNGKVHVTGNSEEQARDMVLALRNFPKSAAGIGEGMTFGSLLAAIANFCSQAINPRLMPLGLRMTKGLCPRFSRGDSAPIRLWYDDCSPADPQQVNADIQQDFSCGAITINEIRALRGRPAYRHGGDDPLLPMGLAPMPLNTGEDLTDIADKVPVVPRESITERDGTVEREDSGLPPGDGLLGGPDEPTNALTNGSANGHTNGKPHNELPSLSAPRVEHPNGKPQKGKTPKYVAVCPNCGKTDYMNMRPIRYTCTVCGRPVAVVPVSAQPPKGRRREQFEKRAGPFKFQTTQFDIPEGTYATAGNVLRNLQAGIDDADLAGDGRETDLHITVRYGFLPDVTVEQVSALVNGFGPVEVFLTKVSIFAADEQDSQRGGADAYDVVKVDVESENLRELNELLASLPHEDTHPRYVPHVTLAYVKPGAGGQYADLPQDDLNGLSLSFSELVFSDKDGKKVKVSLVDRTKRLRKTVAKTKVVGPVNRLKNVGKRPAKRAKTV